MLCSSSPASPGPCLFGLQLIGVFALILFHVWPSEFCNGFMGADILFVVSGFLLVEMLSDNKSSLSKITNNTVSTTSPTISAFVSIIFRVFSAEFCRLLPPFLLSILLSLLAGFVFLFDNGLQQLHEDALWALCFGTNYELSDVDWTFELIGVPLSRPLLHLWIISIHLQCLLVLAPVLLLLIRLLLLPHPHPHLPSSSSFPLHPLPSFIILFSSLFLLAIPSFFLWLLTTSKSVTMGWVLARVWQFLLGSMASIAIQYQTTNSIKSGQFDLTRKVTSSSKLTLLRSVFGFSLFYALVLCLALVFFLPSMFWPSFFQNKILLTTCISAGSAFLLYFYGGILKLYIIMDYENYFYLSFMHGILWLFTFTRNTQPMALARWLCARFGQFPIVCFLLHRPLATFFRAYLDVSLLNIPDGLMALTLISLAALFVQQIFHYFLGPSDEEKTNNPIFGRLILFGYTSCFLLALTPGAIKLSQEKIEQTVPIFNESQQMVQMVPLGVDSVRMMLEQLQQTEYRDELIPRLKNAEKVRINEMLKSSFTFDADVPGTATELFVRENHLQEDNKHVQRIYEWMMKGNGTKHVLVFGNSHAQVAWREVEFAMRNNYSSFHVVSVPGCMPLFEQDWRTIYSVRCAQTVHGLLNLLDKTRPDTLFLIFKWYDELSSIPLEQPIAKDPTLAQMQSFLDKLQQLVAQHIYLSAPNLQFDAEIAHQMAKRIWQNAPLEGLNKNYTKHLEENQWSYARLDHLNCTKCTVFDLAEEFCEPNPKGVCHAFDPDTQLAFFSDTNHISYLGRLRARKMFAKILSE